MKLKVKNEIIIELDSVTEVKRYLKPGEIFIVKPTKKGIMINVNGYHISPYALNINNFEVI